MAHDYRSWPSKLIRVWVPNASAGDSVLINADAAGSTVSVDSQTLPGQLTVAGGSGPDHFDIWGLRYGLTFDGGGDQDTLVLHPYYQGAERIHGPVTVLDTGGHVDLTVDLHGQPLPQSSFAVQTPFVVTLDTGQLFGFGPLVGTVG